MPALLEKAMATHSNTLAWKIPWTEEPGRLQSMVSLRVGHNWVTSLSLFTFMHWRRKWQPTPAFLPGESQGWGSLVGCHLWGCTESDTTEATQQQQQQHLFMCLLAISMSSLEKCLLRSFFELFDGHELFVNFEDKLFVGCFVSSIFSHSVGYLFFFCHPGM